jgi:methionyl-tRNA formyltransferase
MRILLLANAWVGLQVTRYLREQGEELVGLGLHEDSLRRQGPQILEAANLREDRVVLGNTFRNKEVLQKIRSWEPDITVAAFWAYILKPEFLSIAPKGTINCHPGYLPYARGKNPNVWPIVEQTPGGVTIHYVDNGIDTGDIIARRAIPIEPTDTAGTYYDKTLVEMVDLFKETWPRIKSGAAPRISQASLVEAPTFHFAKDVDRLDAIDLDRTYRGRDLVNILRSRTYGNRSFAYFRENGHKVHIGVFLSAEERETKN